MKILLAEDNPVNQKVALLLLEKEGFEVVPVSDGTAAIDAAERESFDLILMDIQMPGADGIEATKTIRRRENGTGKRIPILALTADALKGDCERFLATGMDGYVSKPIHADDLYEAILETTSRCQSASGS